MTDNLPDGYADFSHRDMRPDHVGTPHVPGIPYPIGMSPSKAGGLLMKAAFNKADFKQAQGVKGKPSSKVKGKSNSKALSGKAAVRAAMTAKVGVKK